MKDSIPNPTLQHTLNSVAKVPLMASTSRGMILQCELRGNTDRIRRGKFIKKAGAAAMISMNGATDGFTTVADPHMLQALSSDGSKIKEFISSTKTPKATISFKGSALENSSSLTIASFSRRGQSV